MSPASPATKAATSAKAAQTNPGVDGPYGFVKVTPHSTGSTFALDTSQQHSDLEVTSCGNLTLHWSPADTQGRVVFELSPDGNPTGWSIFVFTLGLMGNEIPLNDYQEMWRTAVRHEPDTPHVDVLLERPPVSVLNGELADFQFTIGYEDPFGLRVVIDPKMTNKGDG